MADIIIKWLADRIGFIFEVNSDSFAEAMKSGVLLAHIFYSYGIFSEEQLQEVIDGSMNQLEVFKTYFKKMGIIYNQEIHTTITSGNISASIKLLYHMYLCLQNKDKLQHIAIAERKKTMMIGTERFTISAVCEEEKFVPKQEIHPFSQPLLKLEHIVTWHKEKHNAFVEKCRQSRREYIEHLNMQQYKNRDPSKIITLPDRKIYADPKNCDILEENCDLNYDQLIHSQKVYEDAPIPQPNPDEAKKLVAKVKTKIHEKHASVMAGIKLKRSLLNQYWDRILKQQHETFEASVIDEALKQSIFEKQMVRKIFEIRQQKDAMYENRYNLNIEIRKKREEEFCKEVLHADVKNQEKDNLYYLEKYRALELHKRLYAEKKRLTLEKTTEMCQQIVSDFNDIAMYLSEYKANYQMDSSKMHKLYLSTLFNKEKPIFDLIAPLEDILNYDPEDCSEEMEEIYSMEMSRQDTIMKQLFYDYIHMKWPWILNLEEYFSPEKLEIWNSGKNVLGHIIYRLLLTKYPKPMPPPPPDLPDVPIAVCMNGLENLAIIAPLKEILRERQIEVIEMQDAINYCLKIFSEEATVEYTETLFDREEKEALELERLACVKIKGKGKETKKKNLTKSKAKPEKKGTKSLSLKLRESTKESISAKVEYQISTLVNKGEQTPRLFPCEELIHSPAGELGKLAYSILNVGELLNKTLMIKMFVQYLMSLKGNNIGGWVLVNFPNTILDATQLEEKLSSKPVPAIAIPPLIEPNINDYVEINDNFEVYENKHIEDVNIKKRLSELMSNPNIDDDPEYKCYLTAFILLKQIVDENEGNYYKSIIETPTDPLNAFYFAQGCKYDLCFKLWDFTTLKTLAKLILGDYSLPRKKSVEILGPSLDYLEAVLDIPTGIAISPTVQHKSSAKKGAAKNATKKSASTSKNSKISPKTEISADKKIKKGATDKKIKKVATDKKKSKSGKGGKKKKSIVNSELHLPIVYHKETQIPEVTVDEDIKDDIKVAKPGEEDWNYIMCSIPEEYQCALATLWENIEEVYINDLKELFFRRGVLIDHVNPYTAFIKTHMSKYISRPDMKQKYLIEFQMLYNQVDKDMRDDDELKAELHCRVFDLRNTLYDICDDRMTENEKERQRLIEDNWPVKTIIEIINIKVTMMQIEIDTFVDKTRLISEYYNAMVTKQPTTDVTYNKYRLQKIFYEEETPNNTVVNFIAYIDELLKSHEPYDSAPTPFYESFAITYKLANDFLNQTYQNIVQNISKLAAIFKPKEGAKKEIKARPVSKKSKVDPKKMPAFLVPDSDVIQVAENLIEEYKCVLEATYIEAQIRLIENYLATNTLLSSVIDKNKTSFLHVYYSIKERYKREISSINLACSLLSRAIEAECRIQPQLILVGEEFLVEPDVLLFEDGLPKPDGILLEPDSKYIYSVQQLQETFNLLRMAAPIGYMPDIALKYLIKDVVTHNPEDGHSFFIPSAWKLLNAHQVVKLIRDLFGNVEYIDWRDYILYNANLKFPESHEILAMRHFYREMDPDDTELVYEHQFQAVTLWFEKPEYDLNLVPDNRMLLRKRLLKNLLWKCFRVDESRLNYTAFLLSLCKGKYPINGIAKALTLSFGKEVCINFDLGEMYLNAELDKRREIVWQAKVKQIEHEDTIKVSEGIVKDIAEVVLDECDSERLIIEEIYSVGENSPIVDNKTETEVPTDYSSIESPIKDDVYEFNIESVASERSDEEFSNVEIGFEEFDFPNLIYILPFDGFIDVLTAALPRLFSMQSTDEKGFRENIEKLYESLRIPDLDNNVYVHRFLHSPEFAKLIKNINKFTVKFPANIVLDMLENK